MKVLKVIGSVVGFIILLLVGFYAYLGGFHKVGTTRGSYGPAEIIFSTHIGPYKDLNASWMKFQTAWQQTGLKECDGLAVYLDPPGTPEAKLRSIIGCRIDKITEAERDRLKEVFQYFQLPRTDAILSSFPFVNEMSYFLGPMKVYPKLQKLMEKESLIPPVGIETYGSGEKPESIGFVMPINIDRTAYEPLFQAFD